MSELAKIILSVSALLVLSHFSIRSSKADDVELIHSTAGPNETPEDRKVRVALIWGDESEEHF